MAQENEKLINSMKLEILSNTENIGVARVAVASFVAQLDLTLNELEELKVAVSEAVSNSIIHGYNNSAWEPIIIEVKLYENKLIMQIEDNGKGIENIDLALQPAYSSDPERMGLGFVFMNSFMDKVSIYSKPNKGTKVIMEKRFNRSTNNTKN